jgi:hypothetical protein
MNWHQILAIIVLCILRVVHYRAYKETLGWIRQVRLIKESYFKTDWILGHVLLVILIIGVIVYG